MRKSSAFKARSSFDRVRGILGKCTALLALMYGITAAALSFPAYSYADGNEIGVGPGAEIVPAEIVQGSEAGEPAVKPRTAPERRLPPGSLSEAGDMKVWDTGGPVEVSPHLPSTTQQQYVGGGLYGAGVIVDARPNQGSAEPIPNVPAR